MDQQTPDNPNQQATPVESQPLARPFSIRLTQIWLGVIGALQFFGGVFAGLRILYLGITQPNPAPKLTGEAGLLLLQLAFTTGAGSFALLTAWGLQKQARVSRWLALAILGFVSARTAYVWLADWFKADALPKDLMLIDNITVLALGLLQWTMFYRFAFGKPERAFLSK